MPCEQSSTTTESPKDATQRADNGEVNRARDYYTSQRRTP
jgi:hypothetical protein